jgi:hypothetical protein
MLVRLYDLPESATLVQKLSGEGVRCRRAESYERRAVVEFVRQRWPNWVDEAQALSPTSASMFIASGAPPSWFRRLPCHPPGFSAPQASRS